MRQRPIAAGIATAILGLLLITACIAVTLNNYTYQYDGVAYGSDLPVVSNTSDVPYGVNVDFFGKDESTIGQSLDMLEKGGFRWLRQPFHWRDIEPSMGQYDWANTDRLVELCQQHNLRLIAVLDGPPQWARLDSDFLNSPPKENSTFANFVSVFAARYKGRVNHLQIWDEPNIYPNWGWRSVDAKAYTALLKETYHKAKAANPDSVILTAALAPNTETGGTNLSDVLYLQEMYKNGARGNFDVVAAQPYGFWTGPYDRNVGLGDLNYSRVLALRQVMVENGDQNLPIWAVEYGWNALPDGWTGKPSPWGQVSDENQALETVQAILRAQNEWPWMGVMCVQGFVPWADADDPVYGFSIVDRNLKPRVIFNLLANLAKGEQHLGVGRHSIDDQRLRWTGDWVAEGEQRIGTSGSHLNFSFKGTAVELLVTYGPNAGKLSVTIDGAPSTEFDLSASQTQGEQVRLASGLEDGAHNVKIAVENDPQNPGNGQTASIGSILVIRDSFRLGYFLILAILVGSDIMVLRRLGALLTTPESRAVFAGIQRRLAAFGLRVRRVWESLHVNVRDSVIVVVGALSVGTICLSADWRIVATASLIVLVTTWWRIDLSLGLLLLAVPFYFAPFKILTEETRPIVSPIEVLVLTAAVVCGTQWISKAGKRLLSAINEEGVRSIAAITDFLRRAIRSLRFSSIDIAIALFLVASIGALLVADSPKESLRELRTVIIEPIVFYYLLIGSLDRKQLPRVVNLLLIGAVAICLLGWIQYLFTSDVITADDVRRMKALYGSPNNLALYLGRIIPLAGCLAVWSTKHWATNRILYVVTLIVAVPALLATFSIGGWIGVFVAAIVVAALRGRRTLLKAFGGIAVILVGAVPLLTTDRLVSHLDLNGGTTAVRLDIWHAALSMIGDHPIFGIGLDQFLIEYPKYMLPSAWKEPNLSHPHNMVLDFWLRLGVAGLIVMGWLLVSFFKKAYLLYRKASQSQSQIWEKALILGLIASMVDFLVHGMIDNSYFVVDLAVVFWFTMAVIRILDKERGLA